MLSQLILTLSFSIEGDSLGAEREGVVVRVYFVGLIVKERMRVLVPGYGLQT
jgi:hypothetical protein